MATEVTEETVHSSASPAAVLEPRTTTTAAFVPTPGMSGFFVSNFDHQLVRAMYAGYSSGGAVGECYATARRIVDFDVESWSKAWSETAERVEGIARHSLEGGHRISARDAFLRAAQYWKTSQFFIGNDPRRLAQLKRSWACFREAAKLFDPPIEPVRIPYENGKTLPGYFMRPEGAGSERRPTLMVLGGGDTTTEELYFFDGAAAVRRGYNALLWEGPGQVDTYAEDPTLTYRPDWEVPTRYAVDYVLSRPEVDPDRLALVGHSFGGYFVPRAAAFERRLKAVIAQSIVPECAPTVLLILGLDPDKPYGDEVESKVDLSEPIKHMMLTSWRERMGAKSVRQLLDLLARFSLAGLETRIECPLLNVATAGEGEYMARKGHEWFEKLTCPKTERFVRGEEGGDLHCMVNNQSLKQQIEFDWLDDVFADRAAPIKSAAGS